MAQALVYKENEKGKENKRKRRNDREEIRKKGEGL